MRTLLLVFIFLSFTPLNALAQQPSLKQLCQDYVPGNETGRLRIVRSDAFSACTKRQQDSVTKSVHTKCRPSGYNEVVCESEERPKRQGLNYNAMNERMDCHDEAIEAVRDLCSEFSGDAQSSSQFFESGFSISDVPLNLESSDKREAWGANQRAHDVAVGNPVKWKNQKTGAFGFVRPVREGTARSGKFCREYEHSAETQSGSETEYIILCKENLGAWHLVR